MPQIVFVYGNEVGSTHINVTDGRNVSLLPDGTHPIANKEVQVRVVHSLTLQSINVVIGWVYFLAWSISFYPQTIENFRRRSVVGLNFDFLCYNLTGFLAYSFFNVGLFYVKSVQDEYFAQYGGSVIPVQPNDVFFALHAVVLTIVTITQCFFFDRGDQRISNICKGLTSVAWLFAGISLVVTLTGKINWYTYLNFFSYIKLGITLIKYIPQAVMNYRRQSTVGWSIGNVLLDFTGGSFSLIQMFFLAYNNNEWNSIFGDFTKFGLGFFSILFDILFMTQHYILYRHSREYTPIEDNEKQHDDHKDANVNKPVSAI
ncbi:cystinosin-like [Clytia hemisphaerica]|uniref:Cystinosin homolog n=1 Tax=Clytia hemisphaerica TaxID=252671 RepID=A0A7M5XH78_9CNID